MKKRTWNKTPTIKIKYDRDFEARELALKMYNKIFKFGQH